MLDPPQNVPCFHWRRRRLAAALLAAELLFVHLHGTAAYWWRALEGAWVNRDFVRDLEVLGEFVTGRSCST